MPNVFVLQKVYFTKLQFKGIFTVNATWRNDIDIRDYSNNGLSSSLKKIN